MIIGETEKLLNEYTQWLKDKTILKQINKDWVEMTTPHLDRHNDYLQVYIRKEENGYLLTDEGYIINDLINSGCSLESPKRQQLLNITLAGFGIQLDQDQLIVRTTPDNFSVKKLSFLQAMLAINELFYLSSPYTTSLFLEDVTNWLDISDVRYTPNVKFSGKSGYDHMFSFVIPKSKQQPERIVSTLANPKKDSIETLVFKWLDTKENRADNSILFAFLQDENAQVSQAATDALKNYRLEPILWSSREEFKEKLAS